MSLLNRRQMLLAAGAGILGARGIASAGASSQRVKKVLFFTKSSGFQHSVIARKGDQLSMAERILTDLGKEHRFEVVASKDGRMFNPDQIGQWDAFVFETTGDLTKPGTDKHHPISADGEKAFFDAIRGGKGFMGMHCATDTMGQHRHRGKDDPYIAMIGGEFAGHGSQQKARILIADDRFPGVKDFGSHSFELLDEWYAIRNIADDLHVILVQDTSSMEKKGGNHMYDRPNYPETWARMHDKGRVFYTSMGHREDVWENPKYQGLLLGALGWITGQGDIDVSPNLKEAAPHYDQLPKK